MSVYNLLLCLLHVRAQVGWTTINQCCFTCVAYQSRSGITCFTCFTNLGILQLGAAEDTYSNVSSPVVISSVPYRISTFLSHRRYHHCNIRIHNAAALSLAQASISNWPAWRHSGKVLQSTFTNPCQDQASKNTRRWIRVDWFGRMGWRMVSRELSARPAYILMRGVDGEKATWMRWMSCH